VITIDASVLVAAVDRADPARGASERFLLSVLSSGEPIHQPTLTLVEVTAAIARRSSDPAVAIDAGAALLAMPGLALHSLDLERAADAAAIAVRSRVRGADAIYIAVAAQHRTMLVTLDQEMRTRAEGLVMVMTPDEWIEAHDGA
jgi:predicted nucleic acid-binding protein